MKKKHRKVKNNKKDLINFKLTELYLLILCKEDKDKIDPIQKYKISVNLLKKYKSTYKNTMFKWDLKRL